MAARRPRELANPDVQHEQLVLLIEKFQAGRTWSSLLGPRLASKAHQICPSLFVRITPLMSDLLAVGFTNCVLPMAKLEKALRQTVLPGEPVANGSTVDLLVGQVAEHIRLCFNMLRLLRVEDKASSHSIGRFRRYPKTGGFRKQLTAADTVLVQSLVREVKLRSEGASSKEDLEEQQDPMPDVNAQPAQAEAKTPPGLPSVEDCMALFRRGTALASDCSSIEQQTQGPIDISSSSEEEPAAETHSVEEEHAAETLSVEEEPAAETLSVADTIEYDEFGCLIQTDLEEPAILPPNSKKRRLAVLNRRRTTKQPERTASPKIQQTPSPKKAKAQIQKTPSPKKAKEITTSSAQKVMQKRLHKKVLAALPLKGAMMSGPTGELIPRVELCAKGEINGKTVRVHIYTATETKWGPSFVSDMKQVAKAVEDQGLTKAEALRLRDQLFAKAGKNDWT